MVENRFLFIPSVAPGGGWGHVARCQGAALLTGGKVWAPEGRPRGTDPSLWTSDPPETGGWHFVVLDRRATDPSLAQRLLATPLPVIGWDEGGPFRSQCDFLVDTLGNTSSHAPNIFDPGLLDLGKPAPLHQRPIREVLVAFGGDDGAHLVPRLLSALGKLPNLGWSLTLLEGPWQDHTGVPSPWGRTPTRLSKPPRLKDLLPNWDLVFCSYGLTAMECLRQGVPFLLLEPSRYHERLSKKAGFPGLGVGKPHPRLLHFFITRVLRRETRGSLYPPAPTARDTLGLWQQWRPLDPACPACGARRYTAVNRNAERTYYRCRACAFRFMKPWRLPPKSYSHEYFHEEYARQYGRGYLDDFDHIQALGVIRLGRLKKISGSLEGRRLLDVGCAYGPFLVAAKGLGVDARGLDISHEAAAWVRTRLGLPATAADFLSKGWEDAIGAKGFDIVSLWYVIEHFPDLQAVMERLRSLVVPGGWLLLSTPNAAGLTARLHPKKFYKFSPDDHFTLWTPTAARKFLSRHGFSVKKVVPTGIHVTRITGRPAGWWGPLAEKVLRLLGWGDTMEIYARRQA